MVQETSDAKSSRSMTILTGMLASATRLITVSSEFMMSHSSKRFPGIRFGRSVSASREAARIVLLNNKVPEVDPR